MGDGKDTAGVRRLPDTTHDAVMVVPGVMGSELVDTATEEVLWGLTPGTVATAWSTGSNLRRMWLSEEERAGRYGRIRATRLLRAPRWLPLLRGFEPYTSLVRALRTVVADPAAVREFPYDWRLPVAHNAGRLAECAMAHLESWRRHPAHEQARRAHPDGRAARLVLVAHSMGGLLVRHLATIPGVSEHIRSCITLGTPFHGAVKAALLLSTGTGTPVPLPARRPLSRTFDPDADHGVRALARTLPGIYDLLPGYRCVIDGEQPRRLEVADVVALGGDRKLAEASEARRNGWQDLPLVGHEPVVGTAQPTIQSLTIVDGIAHGHRYEQRELRTGVDKLDRMGDGTVPTAAAELGDKRPQRLAQQHGALASASDAIHHTLQVVRELDLDLLGPQLGEAGIGLETPDTAVPVGEPWPVVVTGLGHPRDASCAVYDTATGGMVAEVGIEVRDGFMQAPVEVPAPGLYRVVVAGSGASPVTQLVLAG